MPDVGEKAPTFSSKDQDGMTHTLGKYKGSWVLLYFYPKDNTSGCTKEACAIRDTFPSFAGLDAVVLGVSPDSVESHKKFAEKYHLPFSLLSDPQKSIINAYGANGLMTKRMSYLIDPEGNIAKVYPKVDPAHHAEEILLDLKKLALKTS